MYLWQEEQSAETIDVEDDEEEVACQQHIGFDDQQHTGFDEQDPNAPEPDVKEEPGLDVGMPEPADVGMQNVKQEHTNSRINFLSNPTLPTHSTPSCT